MPKHLPGNGLEYRSELDLLTLSIRAHTDRIAAETLEQYNERTYQLALAELGKRKRRERLLNSNLW